MKNKMKIKNWIKEHEEGLVVIGSAVVVYCAMMASYISGRKYEAALINQGLAFAIAADPTLADHIEEASKKALENVKKL